MKVCMARDTIFGGVFWLWDACFLHHTIYLYKEINFKLKISQVKEEQGKTNATKFSPISVVWNTNLKIGCTGMCCSICCKCVVCVFFREFFLCVSIACANNFRHMRANVCRRHSLQAQQKWLEFRSTSCCHSTFAVKASNYAFCHYNFVAINHFE